MRTVSLFSGCGGGDLGAKQAGADIIFAMDNSTNAVKSYQAHCDLLASPDAEIRLGDVGKVDKLPACDLLLGSYPCQSYSMGGHRAPDKDKKASLYLAFARSLSMTNAKYAVVENVAGLAWLDGGKHLERHMDAISTAGKGYSVSYAMLDAQDYGVPAKRRRLFFVAVRKDLGIYYHFPNPSHGPRSLRCLPRLSHGDTIADLPENPHGEYYSRDEYPFSWWYMSRNRKRPWEEPSYTILGNWRHTPLHPASPVMKLVESKLSDGSKQVWTFTNEYDHLGATGRPVLDAPRRLSWREAALLQTFPEKFEPYGSIASKFLQIGNAIPPRMMKKVVSAIVSGKGLFTEPPSGLYGDVWHNGNGKHLSILSA